MHVAAAATASASLAVPLAELIDHRAYLLRFAMRRLRDATLAEDAVHDVFEAVCSGRASFGGRAQLRSWLTAVLKHKIVDAVRRFPTHDRLDGDADDGDDLPAAARLACPAAGPEEVAENRERLARTLAAIEALPEPLREAMRLRVVEDGETADVCRRLGISEENLFVRVHRARKQLLS